MKILRYQSGASAVVVGRTFLGIGVFLAAIFLFITRQHFPMVIGLGLGSYTSASAATIDRTYLRAEPW